MENPRTPKFHTLPKIHKKGNPGRPVISSIDCTTSKISKFVDFHLQPLVRTIPSYIKDTKDFLNKIKNTEKLPENSYLVTMDVKSLYTNIPNIEGIAATRKWLQNSPLQSVLTKVVTTFLALILTKTSCSIPKIICKLEVVPWEVYVHHLTQTSLWQNLRKNIFIQIYKINRKFSYDT